MLCTGVKGILDDRHVLLMVTVFENILKRGFILTCVYVCVSLCEYGMHLWGTESLDKGAGFPRHGVIGLLEDSFNS